MGSSIIKIFHNCFSQDDTDHVTQLKSIRQVCLSFVIYLSSGFKSARSDRLRDPDADRGLNFCEK